MKSKSFIRPKWKVVDRIVLLLCMLLCAGTVYGFLLVAFVIVKYT